MLGLGLIIGFMLGRIEPPECPRVILGYNCQGIDYGCDHRRSEIYRAKMEMALNDELDD